MGRGQERGEQNSCREAGQSWPGEGEAAGSKG